MFFLKTFMDNTERLWSIQDAASYLHIAEKTVGRMIQRGELPAIRIGGQWRFVPEQLSEWLYAKGNRPDTLRDLLRIDPLAVPIDRLLKPEQIVCKSTSRNTDEVLRELCSMAADAFPALDSETYLRSLHSREDLATTALGGGVAIPHIRNIEDNPPGSMAIFTVITAEPINYNGAMCSLFCLVVTDDLVLHLRIIQKLTYVLRREELITILQGQERPENVIARLLEGERNTTHER